MIILCAAEVQVKLLTTNRMDNQQTNACYPTTCSARTEASGRIQLSRAEFPWKQLSGGCSLLQVARKRGKNQQQTRAQMIDQRDAMFCSLACLLSVSIANYRRVCAQLQLRIKLVSDSMRARACGMRNCFARAECWLCCWPLEVEHPAAHHRVRFAVSAKPNLKAANMTCVVLSSSSSLLLLYWLSPLDLRLLLFGLSSSSVIYHSIGLRLKEK